MRILTWNINGVRTLPQYHPWNTLKTFDDILNHLEAEIICFQEMKSSRQGLPKQVSLPLSFDSFFSFPTRKTGYSGVAVYTRRDTVVPIKAEEGLSGLVQPKPPLSQTERVSPFDSYPPNASEMIQDTDDLDYKDLDSEGRALVVDFGLFVLINVYCPNDGTGAEERGRYKMDYHRLLETRVAGLIKEGREVMVLGDLNACAAVQDHCEGELMVSRGLAEGLQGEEGFWGMDYRRWMKDWLVQDDGLGGCMVDVVRKFWPDRKGMYTCWNTKISARATNYGTRIDFILITPTLVPWVKAADIQPQIKGSDHCPVFIDLHDEITQLDGTVVRLSDVLGTCPTPAGVPEPPRLAAKFWDEHKQNLLSTFFGKKSCDALSKRTISQSTGSSQRPLGIPSRPSESVSLTIPSPAVDLPAPSLDLPNHRTTRSSLPAVSIPQIKSTETHIKRKLSAETNDVAAKKPNLSQVQKVGPKSKAKDAKKPGQSTLAGFFAQPKDSNSGSTSASKQKDKILLSASSSPTHDNAAQNSPEVDEDADYRLALFLSQSDDNLMPSSSQSSSGSRRAEKKDQETKHVWTSLLAPTPVPKCIVHGEPAKEFTVNKPGPNKGKKFFVCSRPVGPGYDKGRSERPREQVDPQWRCDFFKWSNDVRKEMARNGSAS